MIEITLPWPATELSPNARVHWSRKAKAAAIAKNAAFVETHPIKRRDMCCEQFAVTLTFHPCDKRKRDIDGLISRCKNALDGICLALNIDDSQFKSVTGAWGDVRKPGAVVVTLEVL